MEAQRNRQLAALRQTVAATYPNGLPKKSRGRFILFHQPVLDAFDGVFEFKL